MSEPDSPGEHRGRAGALARCARCGMHLRLCLCAELRPLALATRVVVVSSMRELPQPTNTGRLVPLTLVGGEVRARGGGPGLRAEDFADPVRRTLLLFPAPGSRVLNQDDAGGAPVTLVVPDGTWRQARKMAVREPALAKLERVHLPDGPPSRYRLRFHPDPRCLATFEAVARALGILEGLAVQAQLERAFALLVERTLWSRGRLRAANVTGGIPPPGTARLQPGSSSSLSFPRGPRETRSQAGAWRFQGRTYSGRLETRADPSSS